MPTTTRQEMVSRSGMLRRHAADSHPLVAVAYRRRASELELQAWVAELADERAQLAA